MPNAKEIKNRISSVKDTQKITNAMYLIASTKLKKAKHNLLETEPYFKVLKNEAQKILCNISDVQSKYFVEESNDKDSSKKVCILCITADKGLAGAYNQNVIKKTISLINEHKNYSLCVVGEYGRTYFKNHGFNIDESFYFSANNPDMDRARRISAILIDKYDNNEVSDIYIVYTEFAYAMNTMAQSFRILPLHKSHFEDDENENIDSISHFEFVPSANEVLDTIVKNYVLGFIYSGIVNSFCAEQNARMIAMDNANENAKKLLNDLNMEYNHIRQAAITQEITEISSGARRLKKIKEALD